MQWMDDSTTCISIPSAACRFRAYSSISARVTDCGVCFIMLFVMVPTKYLSWKGYIDLIQSADVFVFYDEVQYTKNDWRNRNRICSKNGLHWLTIPVNRDSVKLKISEVTLPDPRWQSDHYKTLYQSYRSACYFHQIEP